MAALTYFDVTGTWTPSAPEGVIDGVVAFTMLVDNDGVLTAPTLDPPAVVVPTVVPSAIENNKLEPTSLLANTAALNIDGALTYRADFSNVTYKAPGEDPVEIALESITFAASPDTTPIDLVSVTPAAGSPATQTVLPSTLAAYITDATTLGRQLLTAPDANTARTDLGAATFLGAVSSQAEMLTLQANVGDFCYRSDLSIVCHLTATPAGSVANWAPPRPWPFPMARNTIAVIGDSISALGSEGWYQPWLGHTWINQLQVMSYQRIRYGAGNFSAAGTPISSQFANQLPQVLAMDPLPGACVLAIGTNDIKSTTVPFDLATEAATLKSMVAQLLHVGIVPILWCPPPNNYVESVPISTIHSNMYLWNAWVRRYAAANGFALVDAFTALTQADGTPIPGTINASDNTHPDGYGHRLIAEQFLADGGADIFPPNSLVNTARTTDDLSNLLNNGTINRGLFATDSNSDGVADGLSASVAGIKSLVAPEPSDNLMGNWQQISLSGGGSANVSAAITGWSVGDKLAFSCRCQTSGIDAAAGSSGTPAATYLVAIETTIPGGYELPDGSASLTTIWNGIYQWDGDIDDGELYVEFDVPAGTTALTFLASIANSSASVASLRVGEVTVRNLTAKGLLI